MDLVCESCGRPATDTDREALDDFLGAATDHQRFQLSNRLDLDPERIDAAVLCADCVAAAIQWANVD